jgi:5-methylcytosine-specific restriction endonuclease McrA
VWERDGGRCAWVGMDGVRREGRWKLELDHIHPRALGGPSTEDNLRLTCREHNLFHAERVFGRELMARYRRPGPVGMKRGSFASPA